jgi:hypothetical protein
MSSPIKLEKHLITINIPRMSSPINLEKQLITINIPKMSSSIKLEKHLITYFNVGEKSSSLNDLHFVPLK